MKKLLLALFLPVACFSQKKGDNTIKLPYANYNTIKSILFRNGYTFANNDTTYLTTSSKEMKKVSIAIKLMIERTDSCTYIKGLIKPTLSIQIYGVKTESDFEDLTFRGAKSSPIRNAWNEMNRIANIISSQIIYLSKQ